MNSSLAAKKLLLDTFFLLIEGIMIICKIVEFYSISHSVCGSRRLCKVFIDLFNLFLFDIGSHLFGI